MNINELDLENINEIDTSIDSRFLDDDDSFGSIKIADDDKFSEDDRNFKKQTGVIIDLSDTDDIEIPSKTISADISDNGISIRKNFNDIDDFSGYNEIDMETKYSEDDEVEVNSQPKKGLILEDNTEDGTVSDDYLDKLSKKHKKSITKGAYNTHFHFAGNPEAEREFFNQAMGNVSLSNNLGSVDAASASNITGAAGGGGFGEALQKSSPLDRYSQLLKDILNIINVEIIINSDDSYAVLDLCDDSNEYQCKDLAELKDTLYPYLEDCFIYPLQIETGLNLKSCEDWVNWYTDENKAKYPKIASDITYCDLIANHLDKCKFEDLL